jgi:hypothetical protein
VAFTKDTIAELYPCFRVLTRIGAGAAESDYG